MVGDSPERYSVKMYPGTYDVLFQKRVGTSYGTFPIASNLVIAGDVELDILPKTLTVSGSVSCNGTFNPCDFSFVNTRTGLEYNATKSSGDTYSVQLDPGT
jgi:hypothetical protein